MKNHRTQDSAIVLRRNYDRQNFQAAKIIIADADRYGGPESGIVKWAWLTLGRLQPMRNLWDEGASVKPGTQGELFGGGAC